MAAHFDRYGVLSYNRSQWNCASVVLLSIFCMERQYVISNGIQNFCWWQHTTFGSTCSLMSRSAYFMSLSHEIDFRAANRTDTSQTIMPEYRAGLCTYLIFRLNRRCLRHDSFSIFSAGQGFSVWSVRMKIGSIRSECFPFVCVGSIHRFDLNIRHFVWIATIQS